MIFDVAVSRFGVSLRFIAATLLIVAIYLSYDWLVEAFKRSKSAYRAMAVLGVISVLLAFVARFPFFQWERAAIALLAATVLWIFA